MTPEQEAALPIGEIICGDCREVMAGFPDGSFDAVVTDPPYTVTLTATSHDTPAFDRLREAAWAEDHSWLTEAARVAKPTAAWYVWMNSEGWSGLCLRAKSLGWRPFNRLTWVKTNPRPSFAPKVSYRQATECAMYGACSAEKPWVCPGLSQDDLLGVWYAPIVGGHERTCHPTQKPLSITRDWVLHSCPLGGIVLDPFVGSGTTAVSCVQTGRRFVGIDISPEYCEIARRRVAEALLQPRLDFEKTAKPTQGGMDL